MRHDESDREASDSLDELLEAHEAGTLSPTRYLAALTQLAERYPNFIDGHAHLGFALLKQGRAKLALQASQRGLSIAETAIGKAFTGPIKWEWLENRPFLRAAQGVALCLHALNRGREAIAMMERLLAWNPDDNQGIRFLLGSEYLRAGHTKKAVDIMSKEAEHHPPYLYELALIDFMAGRMVVAATRLRRAFMANGYVPEILCGTPRPWPLAIWHGSNLAEPQIAADYIDHYGDLWHSAPGATAFLRWLHTHPKVLGERAVVYALKEELLWEHDFEKRKSLLDRHDDLIAAIDDVISHEIVVKRACRDGKTIEPWLYPATVEYYF